MIGKLKSMISKLRGEVLSFVPVKAMMLKFEGNGASNPTIDTQYNVASVTRSGVGVYAGTLTQGTFFGEDIFAESIFTSSFVIAPSLTSDMFIVSFVATGALTFDVSVLEVVQGAGNRLDFNPYDILAGDFISASLYLNLGDGSLPPA